MTNIKDLLSGLAASLCIAAAVSSVALVSEKAYYFLVS